MGKVVKTVVSTVAGSGVKLIGKAVEVIGGDVIDDALGLDKIGNEVERIGGQITQVGKVLGGEYHDDMKKIQDREAYVKAEIAKFNKETDSLADKIDRLIAFHEIFQMAASNRLDEYVGKNGPRIDKLISEYKVMVDRLKSEYDFIVGLTEGSFLEKMLGSVLMIIGGIVSDIGDIMSGKADSETWKRVIVTVVTVLAVVAMFFIPGLQGVALAVAVSLTAINAFMTLDGMYANGVATGAIMGVLDTVFNDLLNLDDLIGSDFDKFDSDHEDYKEMVMYTQLVIALSTVAVSFGAGAPANGASIGTSGTMSMGSGAGVGGKALSTAGAEMTGQTLGTATTSGAGSSFANGVLTINSANPMESSFAGIKFSTYSGIYKAYTTAMNAGDVVSANEQYNGLRDKFVEDRLKLEEAITTKITKGFTKSYKDVAYFLQDQQEYIDRYLWGMTAQNMYVDPYGTTPVANIRFTPDKDTRVMSFGYEDVFDDSKMAGSKNYFNSIIYG